MGDRSSQSGFQDRSDQVSIVLHGSKSKPSRIKSHASKQPPPEQIEGILQNMSRSFIPEIQSSPSQNELPKMLKETEVKTKLADMANYSEDEHHYIVTQYRRLRLKFPKETAQVFYNIMNTDIQFIDVDLYLEKAQATARLWAFLVNYIIKVTYLKKSKQFLPFYKFIIIREQNTKLGHLDYKEMPEFMNCIVQQSEFQTEKFDSVVLLLKKNRKYFVVYFNQRTAETTLADFGYQEKSNLNAQDQLFIAKIILMQDFGFRLYEERVKTVFSLLIELKDSDQSEFVFAFLSRVAEGIVPYNIKFSYLDITPFRKRLEYVVIQTGFNDLQRIYDEERNLEEQKEQQRILEYQRMKQIDRIRDQHLANPFDDPKPKLRLDTPPHPDELDVQVELLEKRVRYLKSKQGNVDRYAEFFQRKDVDEKRTKLDEMVETELEELDKMLLQASDIQGKAQIYKNTAQMQQLGDLYQIVNGNFQEKLFKGLGLDMSKQTNEMNKREKILKGLRDSNINTITQPLLNPKANTIPGIFLPPPGKDPSKAVIAYRYTIPINRQQVLNLRLGHVDSGLVEFFLNFLEEYLRETTTLEWRVENKMRVAQVSTRLYSDLYSYKQLGNDSNIEFEYERELFQKYDKILVPIQNGFPFEYQLALIHVEEFKIVHYHLCEIQSNVTNNRRHQINQAWQQRTEAEEKVNLVAQRTKQQDTTLQLLIFWIRKTARHFQQKQLGDMRLWTIRLETNAQVRSPRDSGLYLLLICSLIVCGYPHDFNDPRVLQGLPLMLAVIEYVVGSLGVSLLQLTPQACTSFRNEMKVLMEKIT